MVKKKLKHCKYSESLFSPVQDQGCNADFRKDAHRPLNGRWILEHREARFLSNNRHNRHVLTESVDFGSLPIKQAETSAPYQNQQPKLNRRGLTTGQNLV